MTILLGSDIISEEREVKCPKCGELKPTEVVGTKLPNKPPVYFCGKCGRRLEVAAQ